MLVRLTYFFWRVQVRIHFFFSFSLFLLAPCIPWVAPTSVFKASNDWLNLLRVHHSNTFPFLFCLSLSFIRTPVGPTQIVQNNFSISGILLIVFTGSLLPCEVAYPQIPGIRRMCFCRPLFYLPHLPFPHVCLLHSSYKI